MLRINIMHARNKEIRHEKTTLKRCGSRGGHYRMVYCMDLDSPLGILEITGTEETILTIAYTQKVCKENNETLDTPEVIRTCVKQLKEYFRGERNNFTIPYTFEGTDFQQSVWRALEDIPYGETRSYKDIAVSIGNKKAVRAVGSANGKNKLSIVVPCHRVNGANGQLTGYAGGLWRKEWLLRHEEQ